MQHETSPRFLANISIRHMTPADSSAWEAMRRELWPDGAEDHAPEIAAFFAGTLAEPTAVLVAENSGGTILGFAELAIRSDLPGFEGSSVGYVEGLYVRPEARGRGITGKLLQASRDWAREKNCSAFASDRAERIILDKKFPR